MDVDAEAAAVGELMQQELALEPDEFVATRTIVLRQGDTRCEWVLWADDAQRYGHDLAGRRVAVRGARVQAFRRGSPPQLVGCEHAEVFDWKSPCDATIEEDAFSLKRRRLFAEMFVRR